VSEQTRGGRRFQIIPPQKTYWNDAANNAQNAKGVHFQMRVAHLAIFQTLPYRNLQFTFGQRNQRIVFFITVDVLEV